MEGYFPSLSLSYHFPPKVGTMGMRIATPACGLVRNDTIIPHASRFWDVTFLTKRAMIKEKILRRKQI